MKKLTILTVLLLVTVFTWSQSLLDQVGLDLNKLTPSVAQAMLDKVDMSDATVQLQGPVDLYISGVEYAGNKYAAVLRYDGIGNFEVIFPSTAQQELPKYNSVDFSGLEVIAPKTVDGVVGLRGIVVEGGIISVDVRVDPPELMQGNVVFTPVAPAKFTGMAASHPAAIQAAADAAKEKNSQIKDFIAQIDKLKKELEAAQAAAIPEEGSLGEEYAKLSAKYDEGEKMYYQLKDDYDEGAKMYYQLKDDYDEGAKMYYDLKDQYAAGEKLYYELLAKYESAVQMQGAAPSMAGASTLFVDVTTMQSYGAWKETATGIDMTSADAMYAKIAAQISQTKNEIFYNFTVDANSTKGWIGAGAHILASNVKSLERYAFGKSYLVWLTKDLRTQTDATFVQLYESISDGKMVQLASKAIDGDINSANDVSVYVNKDTDMIIISVNGEEAISYESPTALPDGQIAALRAAGGPVSFSGLSVKAK